MRALSQRQEAILSYLSGYMEQYGNSPSFREIARATNIPSLSIIFIDLNELEKRNYITRKRNLSRAISLVRQEPYIIIRSIPATNSLNIILNTDSPEIKAIFSSISSKVVLTN